MTVMEESRFTLECTPSKFLDFELEDGSDPADCTLRLRNRGDKAAAFKVKTTKPKRYLVRPNQGVVRPSEQLTVSILLLAHDKMELLREYRETGSTNDTDKFMLQILPLDESAGKIVAVSPHLWEKPKAQVAQKKLVVRFNFPRPSTSRATPTGGDFRQTANGIRSYLANERNTTGNEGSEQTPKEMWQQANELRKKYDELVSFTINLTAEKDLILRSLNATKDELQREQRARKELQTQMLEPGARHAAGINGKGLAKKSSGFSLFMVLVVALAALLFGQWTASRYPLF